SADLKVGQKVFAIGNPFGLDWGGSAFAVNAVIETTRFSTTGPAPLVDHLASASGRGQTVMRCPQCHTALWSHYGGVGDKAAFVRAGTLDDP
ncbi:GFA family protein, partial [Klebsiella pneumoniae]|uniref:GFA family protein n=1 Tax=Klebsiella pneumoniae TaxID=573 RepID=UPI0038535037